PVTALAFGPDGKVLASCGGGSGLLRGELRLWEIATAQEQLFLPHPHGVYAVAFASDGRRLVSFSGTSGATDHLEGLWSLRSWDLPRAIAPAILRGPDRPMLTLAFGGASAELLAASGRRGRPGEVRRWDLVTGQGENLPALEGGGLRAVV